MKVLLTRLLSVLAFFLTLTATAAQSAEKGEPLVVHEWGTFTALQDGAGNVIQGVNTDDEPVPSFVYDVGGSVTSVGSELSPVFASRARMTKGSIPRLHPDVTMRLETPVVYFYLPEGEKNRKLDVEVAFKGGWLSQFYPFAEANITYNDVATKRITDETRGTLVWKALEIGAGGDGPQTEDTVWLAPRKVRSAPVRTANGESEKFLFYRGVGNLHGQLTAKRSGEGIALLGDEKVNRIWHVDVRSDGAVAWQKDVSHKRAFGHFKKEDYGQVNLPDLKKDMQEALVEDGLFADEAAAMLETWEHSYFKAPGERVFYLVPQSWTDEILPIRFSVPAQVTRVMIGRIELISAGQNEALHRMRRASTDGMKAFIDKSVAGTGNWNLYMDVASGRKPVSALGAEVPPIYRDYLRLGRFRDALLLDENARNPDSSLASFIDQNEIFMHKFP